MGRKIGTLWRKKMLYPTIPQFRNQLQEKHTQPNAYPITKAPSLRCSPLKFTSTFNNYKFIAEGTDKTNLHVASCVTSVLRFSEAKTKQTWRL